MVSYRKGRFLSNLDSTISLHHDTIPIIKPSGLGSYDRFFLWNRLSPQYSWERIWTATPLPLLIVDGSMIVSKPVSTAMIDAVGAADYSFTYYIYDYTGRYIAWYMRPAL